MMKLFMAVCSVSLILVGCGGSSGDATSVETPLLNQGQPAVITDTNANNGANPNSSTNPNQPSVLRTLVSDARVITPDVQKYDLLELDVTLTADFNNPFDLREIDLMANFIGPNGEQMAVPGFWDAQSRWLIRFLPPSAGEWQYNITAQDTRGLSAPFAGRVMVGDSDLRGWLLPGDQVNPDYSQRYLAYKDGTPFYGVGHADAFAVSFNNNITRNLDFVVDDMREANENYIVYWPYFYFSPVEDNFDSYDVSNLLTMDTFVARFDAENLHMVYTLWDHNQLRGESHPWGPGNWFGSNGFSDLTSAFDFFTNAEAWEWQKNLYRYTIARWGYSPSIAMWQTVSEINGTNSHENTNIWHERMNQYFIDNDPYHHPTTASMSGDVTWDRGHAAMDIPQVHIYEDLLSSNRSNQTLAPGLVIETAEVIAGYTADMWLLEEKPNWIGEYGVLNNTTASSDYPELFHNALWAGLVSGAAMTPAEWNDFFDWGVMTTDMKNHMRFFSVFIQDVPLVVWDPTPLSIDTNGQLISAWGLTSNSGTIIWGLDTTHKGQGIDTIRAQRAERSNVTLRLGGLAAGEYQVNPFNTWTGQNMPSYTFICDVTPQGCSLILPSFTSDIALKLQRL